MVRKLKVDISFLSVKTVVSSRCERERKCLLLLLLLAEFCRSHNMPAVFTG